MRNTIYFPRYRCRRPLRRPLDPRRYRPAVEWFEPRQLLAGGPLQLTITEVETGQSVTVTDNAGTGTIGYIADPLPLHRLQHPGYLCPLQPHLATTSASLTQTGLIMRTTDTPGVRTLQITATDTGYQNPLFPQTLFSFANVTFTNPTASDSATFQVSKTPPPARPSPCSQLR